MVIFNLNLCKLISLKTKQKKKTKRKQRLHVHLLTTFSAPQHETTWRGRLESLTCAREEKQTTTTAEATRIAKNQVRICSPLRGLFTLAGPLRWVEWEKIAPFPVSCSRDLVAIGAKIRKDLIVGIAGKLCKTVWGKKSIADKKWNKMTTLLKFTFVITVWLVNSAVGSDSFIECE